MQKIASAVVAVVSQPAVAGQRDDDFCPTCDAWPRTTVPAAGVNPQNPYATFRRCLTCKRIWEDHHDHTPVVL